MEAANKLSDRRRKQRSSGMHTVYSDHLNEGLEGDEIESVNS